jgi:hypothetical protein
MMVGSCRCLKENIDELRFERVCYEQSDGLSGSYPVIFAPEDGFGALAGLRDDQRLKV